MSNTRETKKLLIQFVEEVWNAGNIEACDKYIAPKYTIHHDPAIRGTSKNLIFLDTWSA